MHAVNVTFEHCVFAGFFDGLFDLFFHLVNHLFDASRVNSAVGDKLFEGESCDFSSYRIEARQGYDVRSIVDDDVNAGGAFQSSDVSADAADDSAFHFVVRKRNHGHRSFGGVIRRATLNCKADDVFRQFFRVFFCFFFNVFRFLRGVFFHAVDERIVKVLFCLVLGEAGNSFKFQFDALICRFQIFFKKFEFLVLCFQNTFLIVQLILFFVESVVFFVQKVFLLKKALLGALKFSFSFFRFLFEFGAQSVLLFFGLDESLFSEGFGFKLSFLGNSCCFLFRETDFVFGVSAVDDQRDGCTDRQCPDADADKGPRGSGKRYNQIACHCGLSSYIFIKPLGACNGIGFLHTRL